METLQNMVSVLNSMGAAQIAAILLVVGLLLTWLIVRASRDEADQSQPANKQPHRHNPAVEAPKMQSQSGFMDQSVTPPIKADNRPTTEEILRPADKQPEIHHAPASESAPLNDIPRDSVLRRHYQAELAAKKQALSNPYPTDSVLRRHYDALHKLALEPSVASEVAAPVVQTVAEQPASTKPAPKASIIELAIGREGQASVVAETRPSAARQTAKMAIPQDSILKRHFISQLQAEIEARLPARPSDSVLRRHYDNLVRHELEKRLAG